MKKVVLSLILMLFCFLTVNAQTQYFAKNTEVYTYDTKNKEWVLYQKNSDTNISIVIEEEFISIQAKSPNMYKIYKSTAENISGKTFVGYRYEAIDLKRSLKCTIDVIKYSSDTYLISIITGDEFNLRYYIIE